MADEHGAIAKIHSPVAGDVKEEAQPEQERELSMTAYKVLVSTIDPSAPAMLFFPYPPSTQLERACPAGYEIRTVSIKGSGVRIGFAFTKRYMYNAIRQTFKSTGIKKLSTTSVTSQSWNIFWGHHLKPTEYAALMTYQKVNHFPGSFELGRKDRLCGNLLRMRKKHPEAYSGIIPETYLTANEYDRQQFLQRYSASPHTLWILKPPNLSCGRGIKIATAATTPTPKLTKKKAYVAQRYVANPFLINELKFDLRIYVLVTSYDPLRVYLFDDGLVRFCTEKYSTSKDGLKNHFGHLTNYSVNKKNSAAFQPNQDNDDDEGGDSFQSSKWSLQMFYKYLREHGKGKQLDEFSHALDDLIIKTFIAVEPKVLMATSAHGSNGFELYGFDVLLEGDEMKPWLLEVNVFPSLSSSSPMDKRIKTVLVSDVFQLIGVPFQDAGAAVDQADKDKRERLLGVKRKSSAPTVGATGKKKRTTIDELLQPKNAMENLDESDLRIVKELEEEEARRGHFKRIFPLADSWERYGALFESHRYKNVLCMRWQQHVAQDPRRRSAAGAATRRSSIS